MLNDGLSIINIVYKKKIGVQIFFFDDLLINLFFFMEAII